MEGDGFQKTVKKFFKGSHKAWNSFLKPTMNTLAPVIGMAVGGKSKIFQVGQETLNNLESISGGNFFSLPDFHSKGLRLKKM